MQPTATPRNRVQPHATHRANVQNKANGTFGNMEASRGHKALATEVAKPRQRQMRKTKPMAHSSARGICRYQSLYAAVFVVGLGRSTFPIGRTFLPLRLRRESPRS